MANTTDTVAKTKKKRRTTEGCPVLNGRDRRLISGFLSAYLTDIETALEGDKRLADTAPDMIMFVTRVNRWRNIISGIKEMQVRVGQRQAWLRDWEPEEIARMVKWDE